MTGLILSHNLTAVFTTVILAVWMALEFRRIIANKILWKLILAAVITIGLTASFTFGLLEAFAVQKYQIPSNNDYQMKEFPKHTLELIDFFIPYEIKKACKQVFGTNWNTEVWHPGAVGIFLTTIFILVFKTKHMHKNKIITSAFWLSVLLYISMFIEPFVNLGGNFLSFAQFPWRLLIFCTLSFSIYAAYILDKYFSPKWQNTYIVMALFCACYTIGPRYVYQIYLDCQGMEYIETINPGFADHYLMEYNPNNGDSLYLPEGVNFYLFEERENSVICSHTDIHFEFARRNGKCYITIANNPYDDTRLELPLYYYKGYMCIDSVSGKAIAVTPSKNGLVEVCLDHTGDANLIVWYKGTLSQKTGDYISALTIIILILSRILSKFASNRKQCFRP